jgi:hypothetical protein
MTAAGTEPGFDRRDWLRRDVEDLKRRLALLDGNGLDPSGGRVGRVENNLRWLIRLGIGILAATILNLVVVLARKP